MFCTFIADINECAQENGGCPQNCTNFPGSFECSCFDGYDDVHGNGAECTGRSFLISTRLNWITLMMYELLMY